MHATPPTVPGAGSSPQAIPCARPSSVLAQLCCRPLCRRPSFLHSHRDRQVPELTGSWLLPQSRITTFLCLPPPPRSVGPSRGPPTRDPVVSSLCLVMRLPDAFSGTMIPRSGAAGSSGDRGSNFTRRCSGVFPGGFSAGPVQPAAVRGSVLGSCCPFAGQSCPTALPVRSPRPCGRRCLFSISLPSICLAAVLRRSRGR